MSKDLTYDDVLGLVCENIYRPIRGIMDAEHFNHPARIYGVPRGGVPIAMMLIGIEGVNGRLQLADSLDDCHFVVDDIIDSGATRRSILARYPSVRFFAAVNKADEEEWIVFPWEKGCEQGPEENVRRLMEYIGEDVNREGLIETPSRVIRSYSKLFGGYKINPASVMKTFEDGACDSMVLLKNIDFYSTCEHHMLPFFGRCHIAYIPNGRVIGVSKLARLMEIFARRMQIQERIGQQITGALEEYLQPKGAACVIEAQHFCMTSRGVEKQNAKMVTSSLTGVFKDNASTRQEFFNAIKE